MTFRSLRLLLAAIGFGAFSKQVKRGQDPVRSNKWQLPIAKALDFSREPSKSPLTVLFADT